MEPDTRVDGICPGSAKSSLEPQKRAPLPMLFYRNPQAMLCRSPSYAIARRRLGREIGACYIPSVAVARRPQQKRAFIVATARARLRSSSRGVPSPQHQHPGSRARPRAAGFATPRLHGLERHANLRFAALVSLQALLARHLE